MNKNKLSLIIKFVITVLTAIAGTFCVQSCVN